MGQLFEMGMLICFGFAWPLSIIASWKARSTKGKSLFFLLVVMVGYACGIAAKFAGGNITYVLFFYILNLTMVCLDLVLYFRNLRLDRAAGNSFHKI